MNSSGWTDEPITTTSADKLSREGYAKRVAQLIATAHTWKSSTVFGLTGPWGSGKTSLVSLIQNALDDNDSDYSVVWFTPWATHDISGLLSEFYSALTRALPNKNRDTARRAFSTLLRISAPAAAVIPFGGGVAAEAAESAADALVAQKPWEEAFREASKQIRSSGKQVLVVVDDVDRLQGNELLTVLKVVRLLGRFPGVQYLLAYDHTSLMHTLTNAGAAQDLAAARRYIEKMVQYPIAVPALLGAQIDTLLNEQLEAVIERRRPGLQTSLDNVRQLSPTMRAMLTTPRAINRYGAQLDYELSVHLDGETHIEDLIILALLRTTLPELHNRLPHFQYELVTGNVHERTHDSSISSRDEKFSTDRLLDGLDDADKRHALKMLHMLFPKLRDSPSISRRQGVAQANYFGRYFTMTILDAYDIADARINRAVRRACIGDGNELITLLRSQDSTLARLAIEKAREALPQTLRETSTPAHKDRMCTALLKAVVPILDELGTPGRIVMALHDLATHWVGADVLTAISDAADPGPITQVLELAPSVQTRISILRAANHSLRDQSPHWWKPVLAGTLPAAQEEFLSHLGEQDRAQLQRADLIDYFRTANTAGVDLAPLHLAIADAIGAGQFEIDHLASRFIHPGSASQFSTDQVGFDIIAPRVDYQWYGKPQEEFIVDADNWVGRRTLAAGRIKRPTDD